MYTRCLMLDLKIDEQNRGYIFSFLMFSFIRSPPVTPVLVPKGSLNTALLAIKHN